MAHIEVIVLSSDDESGVDDSVSLSDQEERLEEFLSCLCDEVDDEAKGLLRLRFRQSRPLYLKSKAFEEQLSYCTRILTSDNVHVLVADLLDALEKNSRVMQVKDQWKLRLYDTPERDPSQEQNHSSDSGRTKKHKRQKTEESDGNEMPSTDAPDTGEFNGEAPQTASKPCETEETKTGGVKLQDRLECMKLHRIKKLERKLEILSKHIRRCEEMDIDLEDMDNEHSAYLAEDKLKRKYIQVQEKLCKLRDEMLDTTERSFKYTGSEFAEINKAITRWVRKNKDFPDVDDIKDVIRKANKRQNLGMSQERMGEESKSVMMDLGKKLQDFRQQQFVRDFGSYLTDSFNPHADPAHSDDELRIKLESQDAFYEEEMERLVDEFAQRQEKAGDESGQQTPIQSPHHTSQESVEDSIEEIEGRQQIEELEETNVSGE